MFHRFWPPQVAAWKSKWNSSTKQSRVSLKVAGQKSLKESMQNHKNGDFCCTKPLGWKTVFSVTSRYTKLYTLARKNKECAHQQVVQFRKDKQFQIRSKRGANLPELPFSGRCFAKINASRKTDVFLNVIIHIFSEFIVDMNSCLDRVWFLFGDLMKLVSRKWIEKMSAKGLTSHCSFLKRK